MGAGLARPVALQVVDGPAHLQRVAHFPPQHLVHVGDQRPCAQARATSHLDDAARQLLAELGRRREGAVAALDVHRQALQAGRQLLRQDARGDQRHALDGGGDVAHRVEALVGGRQVAGLADDGAAQRADDAVEIRRRRRRRVAGDGLELVDGAAGVPQATARDHRHVAAAGRHHRRDHQAQLVAHAAARVLVQHRTRHVGPAHHAAAVHHRARQRDRLVPPHAAQEHRHAERGHLALAPAAVHQPAHEVPDLGLVQRAPLALGPNDFLRQHDRRVPSMCGRCLSAPCPPGRRFVMAIAARSRRRRDAPLAEPVLRRFVVASLPLPRRFCASSASPRQ